MREKKKTLKAVWIDSQVQFEILMESFKGSYPKDHSSAEILENAMDGIRNVMREKQHVGVGHENKKSA